MEKENKEKLVSEKEAMADAVDNNAEDPGLEETLSRKGEGEPEEGFTLTEEKDWLCQKEELIKLVQRKQADLENFRRISRKKEEEIRVYGLFSFMKKLLSVLDNIDRALATAREDKDVPEAYLKGLDMIQKQLLQLLEIEGVRPIEALGEMFDPHFHEAVMKRDDGQGEPGSVVEEIQKGYLYKERVLRPARVTVK